jgi:hypothetical protein
VTTHRGATLRFTLIACSSRLSTAAYDPETPQEDAVLLVQARDHLERAIAVLEILRDRKASPHPESLASADARKRDTLPAANASTPNLPHGR